MLHVTCMRMHSHMCAGLSHTEISVLNLKEQDNPYLDQNCEQFLDDIKKSHLIELGNW